MTMFEMMILIFYYETVHPTDVNQYSSDNGYLKFESIQKTIQVKDAEPVTFQYKKTQHGPIINDLANQVKAKTPVAMWWAYTQNEIRFFLLCMRCLMLPTLSNSGLPLPKIHAPGLTYDVR